MKKADLSINMIVVVAICLIILVIVIFLVANSGKSVSTATGCPNLGGVCRNYCSPQDTLGRYPNVCNEAMPFCCSIIS